MANFSGDPVARLNKDPNDIKEMNHPNPQHIANPINLSLYVNLGKQDSFSEVNGAVSEKRLNKEGILILFLLLGEFLKNLIFNQVK